MPTPVSSDDPYCTGAVLVQLYDWRVLSQLLSDTDAPLATSGTVATAALPFLKAASGKVEMAAFTGGRYTAADLAALTGNMQAKLQRLVADIAVEEIYRRRGTQQVEPLPQFEEAGEVLEALANGWVIFGIAEVIDASTMDHTTDSAQDVENRNLVSFTAKRLFGTRNNRRARQ